MRIAGKTIYDGQWRGRTIKNLWKAIIVHGRAKVSTDLLIDTLWPDADADIALNNLKVAISRLRRFGVRDGNNPLPWIVVKHRQISLSKSLSFVDSFLFQELHAAPLKGGKENKELLIRALNLYKEDFLVNNKSEV